MKVAVVIPTFNEAENVVTTIEKAKQYLSALDFEILVVDNGSADGTARKASDAGATVIVDASRTVGGLRNLGAEVAAAPVLLFLDADVHLTQRWHSRFPAVLESLRANPRLITGSVCSVPTEASWIERYWFEPLSKRKSGYINSGHLLLTGQFFAELGGFDPNVVTGEDYDLCMRARQHGGVIQPDPELVVEHVGFPQTVRSFVARESWHGLGDFQTVRSAMRSKVAMAAMLFGGLHVGVLLAAAGGNAGAATAAALAILLLTYIVCRRIAQPTTLYRLAAGSAVAYLYLLGRMIAFYRALTPHAGQRHQRSASNSKQPFA